MTLNENTLSQIKRAARQVANQWPGVVEAEDVEQSILLRLLESPGSVRKLQSADELSRYRSLAAIGHQLASQERTDYDHYKGSYRYSVAEVKDVLKAGVLIEDVEGFDAVVVDLMDALEVLTVKTPQYAEAVLKRYADLKFPGSTTERDALNHGLTALVREMDKSARTRFSMRDDGLGTRVVLSNAQAHYQAGSDWDGEEDE